MNKPQSYRPTALLSYTYKLLERLVHKKITKQLSMDQIIFKPSPSCRNQVVEITSHIEVGRKKQLNQPKIRLAQGYTTIQF